MEPTRFRVTKGFYKWDNWYFRLTRVKTGRTLFLIDWTRSEFFSFVLGPIRFGW